MFGKSKAVHWNETAFVALISLLLALAQFRLVLLVFGGRYNGLVDAARGVIQGHPHWMMVQSRLLGPFSVEFLSLFLGNFQVSHTVFMIAMMTISGVLTFLFVSREYGRESGWSALFLLNLLLALCNNKYWLYTWDYWDIVLFLLFTYFVFSEKPWIWFLVLATVAVFNRESAFFIALWMILDPIAKHLLRKNGSQFNWKMFLSGVGVFVIGLLMVFSLRYFLLIEETMAAKHPDIAPKSEFHVNLFYNLPYVKDIFLNPESDLVVPIFLAAILVLAAVVSLRDPLRLAALGLTYSALATAVFVFGWLPETRMMLEFIPFVVIASTFIRAHQLKPNVTSSRLATCPM